MNRTQRRNIIGAIACFLSAVLLGGLAVAYWMTREVYQSKRYKLDIETDDIIRYSVVGAAGSVVNAVLWCLLV